MSTSSYISFPVEVDASTIATQMIQQFMTLHPGWEPNESDTLVAAFEVFATKSSEIQFTTSLVPSEIFRFLGKSLFNIPAIDGAPATALSTWTMRDTAGYRIPANTTVAYQTSGSTMLFFRTQADVVVAPGTPSTLPGEVVLVAAEYGTAYNDLDPQAVSLVDALVFVTDVTTTTTTSGGADRETDDEYLNRLRAELQLQSPEPILPDDFAVLARNVAGVSRSTAIDNYDPVSQTFDNERMVAVAVADVDGRAVTTLVKNAVKAYLESLREVNFVVNVIDPTYTTLDVAVTVKVLDGYDPGDVETAIILAVQGYLDPAEWSWSTVVRYNELITLISNVTGVDYVVELSQPSSDVTLPGVAALVTAGSVTVTTQ